MASAGSISIKATLNTSDYEQGKAKIIKGNKEIKSSSDDIDDRGVAKLGLGTKLASSAMVTLGAAAAAAGAAAVAGLGVIGAQAIKSYAEMEQLKGGIDKLFGSESAAIVEANAAKAFKTAQISAEKYMTTATRFSAKLVKDLGGDTKKAAQMVDVAITDMSDNANTFGTSMDSLIETYQGFAKQNYTMLDNLNLGYGGTAEQMAKLVNDSRVLGDTTEITAKTINDVSFDKIIEAINVIQKEVGIYGVSLKEAETTVSGSWKMMTSSWQDMMSGVEGSGANFAKSIEFLFTNLSKTIPVIISDMGKNTQQIFNELVPADSGLGPFVQGIKDTVAPAIESVKGAFASLRPFINTVATIFRDNVMPILREFGNFVRDVIQPGIDNIRDAFSKLQPILTVLGYWIGGILLVALGVLGVAIGAVVVALAAFWTAGTYIVNIIISIVNWVSNLVISIITGIPSAVNTIRDGFNDALSFVVSIFTTAAGWIGQKFTEIGNFARDSYNNIRNAFSQIPAVMSGLFSDAWNRITGIFGGIGSWFGNLGGQMVGAGRNIIDGLIRGISGGRDAVVGKIREIASGALDAIKNFFGIHSPSRVMRDEVGYMLMAGLGIGIDRGETMAVKSAVSASESVLGSFGGNIGYSASLTSTNHISESFTGGAGAGVGASIVNNYNVHNDVDVEKISRQQEYILRTKR